MIKNFVVDSDFAVKIIMVTTCFYQQPIQYFGRKCFECLCTVSKSVTELSLDSYLIADPAWHNAESKR